MKKNRLNLLSNELRQAGAAEREIAPLTSLAARLQHLRAGPSPAQATAPPMLPKRRPTLLFAAGCSGLAVLVLLVSMAQSVLPGSPLYPVKRLSEQAAVTLDSNYRATIMMRRANEVQKLVTARAGSQTVLATLDAYKSDAAAYRTGTANYAAFEYCKSKLQQAEPHATPAERQAIRATLDGLRDV